MRRATRAIAVAVLMLIAMPAIAEDYVACWVDTEIDPVTLRQRPVTRCRLAGGELVDYASDFSVPAVLSPSAGTDLTGDCWYLTSRSTNWVYLSLFINGDAILGWDPDPSTSGGIAFATGRVSRCTSEPNPYVDPAAAVWEYVTSYVHPPPEPDLNPTVGDGITGLETFAGVQVPTDHLANLNAGGLSLEVSIVVSAISVDWGDEESALFPTSAADLSGYPDGDIRHTYESKDQIGYDITVGYDWTVRWRVPGGPWNFLAIPDTTTAVSYPVAEIISVVTP